VKVDAGTVELAAFGPPVVGPAPPFSLTLASAVPKGDRFDWLVEKATELGVVRVIPLLTDRSVVEPGAPKLERLRRAIIEASKQCGRNELMILDAPVRWERFAELASDSLRFLADPDGLTPGEWTSIPGVRSVILAVGPEGGFAPAEKEAANRMGWIAIRLGSTILRIETAGLAGCAALFSHAKDRE
jgi:16S rRNA (uracil1498-N3)-methyltransferase